MNQPDRDLDAMRAAYRDADDLLDDAPSTAMRDRLLQQAAAVSSSRRRQAPRRWPAALAASVITCTFAGMIAIRQPPAPTTAADSGASVTRGIAPAAEAPRAAIAPDARTDEPMAPSRDRAIRAPEAAQARSNDLARQPSAANRSALVAPMPAPQAAPPASPAPVLARPAAPSMSMAAGTAAKVATDELRESAAPPPTPMPASSLPAAAVAAPERRPTAPAADMTAPAPALQPSVLQKSTATASGAALPSDAQARNEVANAPRRAGFSASTSAPASPSAESPPAWEADPKAWLRHIAELRRLDRNDEADRELRRFRERYPLE